jgi:hypothetical protein
MSSTNESINRVWTSAPAARGRAKRTLSAVAGTALPGEEAEGTVPRVLELAVRHPRLSSPFLHNTKNTSDPPQKRQERLSTSATKRLPPTSAANRGGRDGRRLAAHGQLAHLWGAAARGCLEAEARKP